MITKRQFAERLGISTRTLDRWLAMWRSRGLKIGVKIRGTVRFPDDMIERVQNDKRFHLR